MYEEIEEDVEAEIERQLKLIDDASLSEDFDAVAEGVPAESDNSDTIEEASSDTWHAALNDRFGEFYTRIESELVAGTADETAKPVASAVSALPTDFLDKLEAEAAAEDVAAAASDTLVNTAGAGDVPPLDLTGAVPDAADGLRSGRSSSVMTVRQLESTNPDKRIIEAWMETEEELIQIKTERWRLYSNLTKASVKRRPREEETPTPSETPLPQPSMEVDDRAAQKQLAEEEQRQMQSLDALLDEERRRTLDLQRLSKSVTAKRLYEAAVTIQRHFRGYRIRNRIGEDIQRQMERARKKVFNEKVIRIEKERQRQKVLEHHRRRQEGESRLTSASSRVSSRSSSSLSGQPPEATRPTPPPALAEVSEAAETAESAHAPPAETDNSRTASTYVLPDQRFPPLTGGIRDPNYSPGALVDTRPSGKPVPHQKHQNASPKGEPSSQKRPTSANVSSRQPPVHPPVETALSDSSLGAETHQASETVVQASATTGSTAKTPRDGLNKSTGVPLPAVAEVENSESSRPEANTSASGSVCLEQKSAGESEIGGVQAISTTTESAKPFSLPNSSPKTLGSESEPKQDQHNAAVVPVKTTKLVKQASKPGKEVLKSNISASEPTNPTDPAKLGSENTETNTQTVGSATLNPEPAQIKSMTEVAESESELSKSLSSEPAKPVSGLAESVSEPIKHTSKSVKNLSEPTKQTKESAEEVIDLIENKSKSLETNLTANKPEHDAAQPKPEPVDTTIEASNDNSEPAKPKLKTTSSGPKSVESAKKSVKSTTKSPAVAKPVKPLSAREKSEVSAEIVQDGGSAESAVRERTTDHISDLGQDLFIARLGWVKSQPTYAAVLSAAAAATPSPKRRPRRQPDALSSVAGVSAEDVEKRLLSYSVGSDGCTPAENMEESTALCLERLQPPLPAPALLGALGHCSALRALRLADCGLATLPALAAGCPQLQLLDVSCNSLQNIDVTGLDQLFHLSVSRNRLTNLYGMETAKRLVHLDVSDNCLTKLDFGALLPRLLHLNASRNQLAEVPPGALHLLPSIVWLNLSGNHIGAFDSASGLPCLAALDLTGNDLSQFPALSNSPLLVRLNLAENSLTSMPIGGGAAPIWLPCLLDCDLGRNQLACQSSHLASFLARCPLLRRLDVSANSLTCLSEPDLTQVSASCPSLELLNLTKNPGAAAAVRRLAAANRLSDIFHDRQVLPGNADADVVIIRLEEAAPPTSQFLRKCVEFSSQLTDKEGHFAGQAARSSPDEQHSSLLTFLRHSRRFYGDCFQAVKRQRCYQEFEHYLDVRKADLLQYDGLEASLGIEQLPVPPPITADVSALPQKTPPPAAALINGADEQSRQREAAVKIQAAYRGYAFRRRIDDSLVVLEHAALRIQSTWRGHQVRQWIRAALASVKDADDADGVNMDEDDMNEADIKIDELDVDAMFADIQLPNSPRPDSSRRKALPPKDAWINSSNSGRFTPLSRLDLKGSLQVNTHRSDSTTGVTEPQPGRTTSQSTHRSKKIDQIKEDWGFHDERSAQMMLERAKKMKLNSDKRKRLSKLDPQQRYILFKKLEASSRPVVSSMPSEPRAPANKIEYFKAKELERLHEERARCEDSSQRGDRTFEWVFNSPVTEPAGAPTGRPRSHEESAGGRQRQPHQQPAVAVPGRDLGFLPHIHSGRSNSLVSQSSVGDRAGVSSAGGTSSASQALLGRAPAHQLPPIQRRK